MTPDPRPIPQALSYLEWLQNALNGDLDVLHKVQDSLLREQSLRDRVGDTGLADIIAFLYQDADTIRKHLLVIRDQVLLLTQRVGSEQ